MCGLTFGGHLEVFRRMFFITTKFKKGGRLFGHIGEKRYLCMEYYP